MKSDCIRAAALLLLTGAAALQLSGCGGRGVDVGGDETVEVSFVSLTEPSDNSGLLDEVRLIEPVLHAIVGVMEASGGGYRENDAAFVTEITRAALVLASADSSDAGEVEKYARAAFLELDVSPEQLASDVVSSGAYDVSGLCGVQITDAARDGENVIAYVSAIKSDGSVSGIYIVTLEPDDGEASGFEYRVAACVLM